jgi:hypothetical protein
MENDMATQAELDAAATAAKTRIEALIKAKVPEWAQGMITITDVEVHDISDAAVIAAEQASATQINQGT